MRDVQSQTGAGCAESPGCPGPAEPVQSVALQLHAVEAVSGPGQSQWWQYMLVKKKTSVAPRTVEYC